MGGKIVSEQPVWQRFVLWMCVILNYCMFLFRKNFQLPHNTSITNIQSFHWQFFVCPGSIMQLGTKKIVYSLWIYRHKHMHFFSAHSSLQRKLGLMGRLSNNKKALSKLYSTFGWKSDLQWILIYLEKAKL